MESGWSYLVAIVLGTVIVTLWKGRGYWKTEVFEKQNTMTAGTFIQLLCVFLSAQFIFQIVVNLLEMLLNLVGLTAFAAIEMASTTGTNFSMFLYASGFLTTVS